MDWLSIIEAAPIFKAAQMKWEVKGGQVAVEKEAEQEIV